MKAEGVDGLSQLAIGSIKCFRSPHRVPHPSLTASVPSDVPSAAVCDIRVTSGRPDRALQALTQVRTSAVERIYTQPSTRIWLCVGWGAAADYAVRRSKTFIVMDRPLPPGHDPRAGSGVAFVGRQRGSWPSHILVEGCGRVGCSTRPSDDH
jgi:hypothetical protein